MTAAGGTGAGVKGLGEKVQVGVRGGHAGGTQGGKWGGKQGPGASFPPSSTPSETHGLCTFATFHISQLHIYSFHAIFGTTVAFKLFTFAAL